MQSAQSPRLRRNEASEYLKSTWGIVRRPSTLAKYASLGGGPKIQYVGKIPTYTPVELDIWAKALLSPPCSSTADRSDRDPHGDAAESAA
jgi:hypothetical protein